MMSAAQPYGLQPGHTSTIRRVEGGMLSYQADMDMHTNPFELGLDRLVDLDIEADFIEKQALKDIQRAGVTRKQVGILIDGDPVESPNTRMWPLSLNNVTVGHVTSAVYSPRLDKNIALAMIMVAQADIGTDLVVDILGESRRVKVVEKPFYDPNKRLAVS